MPKTTVQNQLIEKGSLAHQDFSRCVQASGNPRLLSLVFGDLDNPHYPIFYRGQKFKRFSSTEAIGLKIIYSAWNSNSTHNLSVGELSHLSFAERKKFAEFLIGGS